MELTHWIRMHRRLLLALLGALLMIAFLVGPTLQALVTRAGGSLGVIRGETVGPAEMQAGLDALRVARLLGMTDPRAPLFANQMGASPRAISMLWSLSNELDAFVFAEQEQVGIEPAWRFMVLVREAEAGGLTVTDGEMTELLGSLPAFLGAEGFSRARYEQFLSTARLRPDAFSGAMRDLAAVAKLITMKRDSVWASDAELWMIYGHLTETVRIRYVRVDAHWFEPLVEVTRDEMLAFYEEHKDRLADEEAGVPGYMVPARVKVEYAVPRPEALAETVEVSDEEVEAYYVENRDLFVEDAPAEAEEQPAEQPSEGESPGEAEEPREEAEEAGTRVRPLDEVRQEIRDTLVRRKADELAGELVRTVLDETRARREQYANAPRPLGQMARRHGLAYQVAEAADGRRMLSREEVAEILPRGASVAEFAFEHDWSLYYPTSFGTGADAMICQVLERRDPEPRPFAEVEDEVRADLTRRKALEHAEAFAGTLRDRAAEGGLRQAAEAMAERLRNLLGPAPTTTEAGGEGEEGSPTPLISVEETEFFSRSDAWMPGIEERAPEVVEAAFRTPLDGVDVAVQREPAWACFVVQPIERGGASEEDFADQGARFRAVRLQSKRRQMVLEWMEGRLRAARPGKEVEG